MVYVWTLFEGFIQFHFHTFEGPSWSSFATKLLLYTGGNLKMGPFVYVGLQSCKHKEIKRQYCEL